MGTGTRGVGSLAGAATGWTLATLAWVLCAANVALAERVVVDFEGVVTSANPPLDISSGGVFEPDQKVRGMFIYDSSTQDVVPEDPQVGRYPDTVNELFAEVGGYTVHLGTGTNPQIIVADDELIQGTPRDTLLMTAPPAAELVSGLEPLSLAIRLPGRPDHPAAPRR
jgi:hypothetical protein